MNGDYIESSNTIAFILSDNGTPSHGDNRPDDDVSFYRQFPHPFDSFGYDHGHAKSTLYEGGVRVPLIVFGAGVVKSVHWHHP